MLPLENVGMGRHGLTSQSRANAGPIASNLALAREDFVRATYTLILNEKIEAPSVRRFQSTNRAKLPNLLEAITIGFDGMQFPSALPGVGASGSYVGIRGSCKPFDCHGEIGGLRPHLLNLNQSPAIFGLKRSWIIALLAGERFGFLSGLEIAVSVLEANPRTSAAA